MRKRNEKNAYGAGRVWLRSAIHFLHDSGVGKRVFSGNTLSVRPLCGSPQLAGLPPEMCSGMADMYRSRPYWEGDYLTRFGNV